MIMLADISSELEHRAGLGATNWSLVAETLKPFIEKKVAEPPRNEVIPKIADFSVGRILGDSSEHRVTMRVLISFTSRFVIRLP